MLGRQAVVHHQQPDLRPLCQLGRQVAVAVEPAHRKSAAVQVEANRRRIGLGQAARPYPLHRQAGQLIRLDLHRQARVCCGLSARKRRLRRNLCSALSLALARLGYPQQGADHKVLQAHGSPPWKAPRIGRAEVSQTGRYQGLFTGATWRPGQRQAGPLPGAPGAHGAPHTEWMQISRLRPATPSGLGFRQTGHRPAGR